MKLRTRLLWLFVPPLLLVLSLVYFAAQGMLLARLDKQDERLLVAEAERLRALLGNSFERDANRLRQWAQAMPGAVSSAFPLDAATLGRSGFDFILYFANGEQRVSWRPLDLASLERPAGAPALSLQALHDGVAEQLARLLQPQDVAPPAQLLAVLRVPLILVAVDTARSGERASGVLLAGTFLDSKRIAMLQQQLGGELTWLPSATEQERPVLQAELMSIGNRQVVDARHQSIDLLFQDSLGEPQLRLQLTRERHLYLEGERQLNVFLGVTGGLIGLAWLLIYLALDVTLLRRIARLHHELLAIGPAAAGRRLTDDGRDELGKLAREANRALDRLEQSEARDRAILDAMEDGYFELDELARIESVNPAFCRLLGYPADQVLGLTFASLQAEPVPSTTTDPVIAETEPGAPLSARLRRADGSIGHFETQISRRHNAGGRLIGYRGILHDVSEHVLHQRQLFDLAHQDALTGLGNRKAFHEDLARHLHGGALPLALIFLDLDRFKQVNDRFGHDVGDALLVCMAERLCNALRQPDKAYRLGGDEFTVIVPMTEPQAASALARRLLKVLGEPVSVRGLSIDFVTPSIGLALAPAHASEVDALVRAADQAMYQAKRQRGQVCVFQPSD
ncbi:diguanylate cyclase domain-containing protein [Pseudomonas sp.]|uniref:diguanylate cyclase domain-containing protein n=1 Tax=Pseudomonas sp. TaxID=306 RepID=UPI0028A8886F|nr:diguanylate cyclase [Pseudomonas sp.]